MFFISFSLVSCDGLFHEVHLLAYLYCLHYSQAADGNYQCNNHNSYPFFYYLLKTSYWSSFSDYDAKVMPFVFAHKKENNYFSVVISFIDVRQ